MGFDIIEDFPFMLRHSKHSEPFFSNLLCGRRRGSVAAQFPNTFFKRSITSGGWLVTSLARAASPSPLTGSNS